MIARLIWTFVAAAVLALLWVIPDLVFPNPGTNDALELSVLGPLIFLITVVASLLSIAGMSTLRWGPVGPVGAGAFLLGIAAAFGLAALAFGNLSNDRFAPLLITPGLALPAGLAIVVVALAKRSPKPAKPLGGGALRGAAGAIVVAGWLLARGPSGWLRAPYGFDTYLLVAAAAAVVLYLGVRERGGRSVGIGPGSLRQRQ